jgi:hypothetical protein
MWMSGIDDGSIGKRLVRLEVRMRQSGLNPASIQALQAIHTVLLLRLADLALEDDAPLPGADEEFQRARDVLTAMSPMPQLPTSRLFRQRGLH